MWHDEACNPDNLDHAVLLVGYGQEDGKYYWLIKNSWSSYWGDQGFVKIALAPNDCGVATSPSYAVLKDKPSTNKPTTPRTSGASGLTFTMGVVVLSISISQLLHKLSQTPKFM